MAASSGLTNGPRVAWFLENHCVHVEGAVMGQRLVAVEHQHRILDEAFRLEDDGARYWRRFMGGLPRKNAKSELSSGVGHYLLSPFDGEGAPQGFSAAYGTTQARVTHNAAKSMVELSPRLQDMMRNQRDVIICDKTRGTWRVVSKLADLMQGTNPHFAIIDEYHVHKNAELYEAFRTGMGARSQPYMWGITTAGIKSDAWPLWRMYEQHRRLEDVEEHGELRIYRDHTSRSLMMWWGLVPEDDWSDIEDPAVVRACNPAPWLDPQRLIDENLHGGMREQDFRRYHLNQFVAQGDDNGIPAALWDACKVVDAGLPDGASACVGVDIGFRNDWSAVVAVGDVDGRLHIEAHLFEPPEGDDQEIDLQATVVPCVEDMVRRLRVEALGVDPWGVIDLMQTWQGYGWPVVEFRQDNSRMCPASQSLFQAVSKKRFAHDGDAALRDHVLNGQMKDMGRAWKFVKPKDDGRKIDALIALLMATFLWETTQPDAYGDRGMVML